MGAEDDDDEVLAIGCDVVGATTEVVMSISWCWGEATGSGEGEGMREERLLVVAGSDGSGAGTAVFVVGTRDGLSVLAAAVGG